MGGYIDEIPVMERYLTMNGHQSELGEFAEFQPE